ncbi:M1 family aminopeptidase [Pseudonocardia nematodicida]|uniref:M1 family aminopeptidase n=1 Tax=Pseudonocardia nematodicida TaxID=1206997 RepID=A0ABV1K4D4_9PSEU
MSSRLVAPLVALALLGGCAAAAPAPAAPAAPDPDRPVVSATLDLADDLGTATGTHSVRFTPDREVCEVVLRLWTNRPTTVRNGNSTELTSARVDGAPVDPQVEQAGAPDGAPGTLVTLPMPSCVPAGTPVTAETGFETTLGDGSTERIGRSGADTAWLGSPLPVLPWVRGEGWIRDPAVGMSGEQVVAEDFRLESLEVTAGDGQAVVGVGDPAGTGPAGPGRTAHRFTADAIRDVAVAVGDYEMTEAEVNGVAVRVGVPDGADHDGDAAVEQVRTELGKLEELLGPHPYRNLWVTIVPGQSDGIEFPTHLQFGSTGSASLVAHELAHSWFYSLVGNDQGRDPWLDETFATWAQAIVSDQFDYYRLDRFSPDDDGPIGAPMSYWDDRGGFSGYVTGVYDQGAAALLEGRERVGEERFDAAMRGYLDANAHRVAGPADVETAFADLPEVLEVLREHGAFDSP